MAWNKVFFKLTNANFSYARERATPKIIYLYISKTKIRPEIKHFSVAKCKIFIGKAGTQPPKTWKNN